MLSTSHNFLFIHVPKTAGNAIQDALRIYSDDEIVSVAAHHDGIERFAVRSSKYNTAKHSTYSDYELEYGSKMMANLFKFACVRNPWDRCMSHYFSPHRGKVEWNKDEFLQFVNTTVQPLSYFFSKGATPQPIGIAVENMDLVIRYEALGTGIQNICKKIGVPPIELARRNVSPQTHPRRFYDAESAHCVSIRFAEEIEHFNYSFDT